MTYYVLIEVSDLLCSCHQRSFYGLMIMFFPSFSVSGMNYIPTKPTIRASLALQSPISHIIKFIVTYEKVGSIVIIQESWEGNIVL